MATRILRCAISAALCVVLFGGAKSLGQSLSSASTVSVQSAETRSIANPRADESKTSPATAGQNPAKSANTPLSASQKFKFGLRGAFFTPGAYVGPAIDAYFVERREVKAPGKTSGDNFADGASRDARAFATRSSAQLFGWGIYPILFKQDPRYYRSPRRGFGQRVWYAATRTFVSRSDVGRPQANLSEILGDLTSASLANIYERNVVRRRDTLGRPVLYERRVGVRPTFETFGISLGLDSVNYVLIDEFDVVGKLWKIIHK